MFIELEPIFNNVGSSKKFSYSFVPDGIDFTDNVSVEGEVVNNTDIVSVKAVAKYVLKTNCDRCGAPVERKTEVPIEHILISHLNDEDNDEFILVEDMKLDLDSLVREDMILALPAKILCVTIARACVSIAVKILISAAVRAKSRLTQGFRHWQIC